MGDGTAGDVERPGSARGGSSRGSPLREGIVQALRFYATGALNTAFGFGLYIGLVWLGMNPFLAQLVSRIGGTTFNYYSYRFLVFSGQRLSKPRFLLSYIGNYLFSAAVLAVLLRLLHNPYLAGTLSMVISTAANFAAMRWFVARPRLVAGAIEAELIEAGAGDRYRPFPRDWHWLPEWALLAKDTAHDLGHALAVRMLPMAPVRRIWLVLRGNALARRIEAAGALLVHIPRTGGTSISRQLYGRNLPHHPARRWRALFRDRFDEWARFAVLRDPVARFASAYRFTLDGGNELILNSRFEAARLGPLAPLEAFVARLEGDPALLRAVPMFRPQVDFLSDRVGGLLVDHLFVIEGDVRRLQALARWLGIASIPHINASRPCGEHFEPAIEARIRALYAQDCTLYERVLVAGGQLTLRDRTPLPTEPRTMAQARPDAAATA